VRGGSRTASLWRGLRVAACRGSIACDALDTVAAPRRRRNCRSHRQSVRSKLPTPKCGRGDTSHELQDSTRCRSG